MSLEEFNRIYDQLLDRGDIAGAFEFADTHPDLMKQSVEVYSVRVRNIDVNAAYACFRQIVFEREGEEGIKRLERYNHAEQVLVDKRLY